MSTSVRLDEETKRRIKALAAQFACSEATIMRQALGIGLDHLESGAPWRPSTSPAEKD